MRKREFKYLKGQHPIYFFGKRIECNAKHFRLRKKIEKMTLFEYKVWKLQLRNHEPTVSYLNSQGELPKYYAIPAPLHISSGFDTLPIIDWTKIPLTERLLTNLGFGEYWGDSGESGTRHLSAPEDQDDPLMRKCLMRIHDVDEFPAGAYAGGYYQKETEPQHYTTDDFSARLGTLGELIEYSKQFPGAEELLVANAKKHSYISKSKQDYIDAGLTITEADLAHLSGRQRLDLCNSTVFDPKDGLYRIIDRKLLIEDQNDERSVARGGDR